MTNLTTATSTTRILTCSVLLSFAGCGSGADKASPTIGAENQRQEALIEEPDLYRVAGTTLYVQNRETGLNVVDLTDAAHPRLVGRAAVTGGAGAELYVQPNDIVAVLLKAATDGCRALPGVESGGWSSGSELVIVDAEMKSSPEIRGRYCLPGTLVASRTVDRTLFAVSSNPAGSGSRAVSIDLANPRAPHVVDQADFPGASKEILVTATAIVVAAAAGSTGQTTRVQYFSIAPTGTITPRGSFTVPGAPQGRFHMDLAGAQFRIVTFDSSASSSRLSILDVTNPDQITFLGGLGSIGRSEKLYATRFDGDLAYVVTFRRTDPLWIISLKDPRNPVIESELQVPGWSDYLFPRGKRLVAVGRAADLRSVGLSLFDVSNPSNPVALHQITLGGATSEANLDHRGVTILDSLGGENVPVLVIPYATVDWSSDDKGRSLCAVKNQLQLVDIQQAFFAEQGSVNLRGTIRRSFPVGGRLYALSDFEVKALDVGDRGRPTVAGSATVGTDDSLAAGARDTCDSAQQRNFFGDDVSYGGCSVAPTGKDGPLGIALAALALCLSRLRRRSSFSNSTR